MEVKGHSGEVSNGSEKQIIRNGREKKKKKETGGKVILVESGKERNWVGFSHFMEGRTCQWWNLMIFEQNVEGAAWILLTAYTKMQE